MPRAIVFGVDREWRLTCAETLRKAGFELRLASSSAELMKALAATREALLILDGAVTPGPTPPGVRAATRDAGETGAQTAARILATVDGIQPTSSA